MGIILGLLIVFNKAMNYFGLPKPQLLHLFAAVVLGTYIVKRNHLIKTIAVLFGIMAAYVFIVQLVTRSGSIADILSFLVQSLLNITLMIWIVNSIEQLDKDKFIITAAISHLILTVTASIVPNTLMWQAAEYFTGTKASRLKLLYADAAELSYVCGFFLLLCVYRLISQRITWKIALSGIIFLIDMLASYGMAGMIAFLTAVCVMIMGYISSNRQKIIMDNNLKIKWAAIILAILVVIVAVVMISPIYGLKVGDIIEGKDNGLIYTIKQPFAAFIYSMHETAWAGVGLGGINSTDMVHNLGYAVRDNSFMTIAINGGATGVILLILMLFCFLWLCLLYGNILNISFMIFTILFQCASGKFEDPIHWLIYGVILVDCMKTRAVMEDNLYS